MAGNERTKRAATTAAARSAAAASRNAGTGTIEGTTAPKQGDQAGRSTSAAGELSGPLAAATPIETARISCLMNAEYHGCREAFLDTVHRWLMFGVIAFGAAALIDALPKDLGWLRSTFPGMAALLGALDLTFDLSNRARTHAMMKRRYFDLLADLAENRKTAEEVRVCLERYSADEEPPYRVLLLSCWNTAQRTVFGKTALQFAIPKSDLAFKNLIRRTGVDYGAPSIVGSGAPSA